MPTPDLSQRSTRAELMDDPDMPEEGIRRNLQELETVNKLLGGYRLILKALEKIDWPRDRPLHLMDIGSGGGDTLRVISDWALRKNKALQLTGVDLNPVMIAYAQEFSAGHPQIRYCLMDVFDEALLLQPRPDIITCNLFCHHFRHTELVRLLQRLYSLTAGFIIINDLHRHWIAYHSIRLLSSIFSKSFMVKHDGPLSVARAFKKSDWNLILTDAGLSEYTIKWRWAWRWEVIIHKNKPSS